MFENMPLDELARRVNALDRDECIDRLAHFDKIPLDFNEDFLEAMSVEKLRHVLMAALLTTRMRPRRPSPPPMA